MGIPSPVTIKKGNVEFVSTVDRQKYLLVELQRAALRDVAKMLRQRVIIEMKKRPGMKRSKRPYRAVQVWVRKMECDLQIGYGNTKKGLSGDTWYAIQQELGTKNQPAKNTLRNTTFSSIDDIVRIEARYLSEMENEARALGLIAEEDEGEGVNNDDG